MYRWKRYLGYILIANVIWILYLYVLYNSKLSKSNSIENTENTISNRLALAAYYRTTSKSRARVNAAVEGPMDSTLAEFIYSTNWTVHRVQGITCSEVVANGSYYFTRKHGELTVQRRQQDIRLFSGLTNETLDCASFTEQQGYVLRTGSQEERAFPLAYSIVVYKEFYQVERLIRAIYRPQNVYCIHYDVKSSEEFKIQINILADCFENVFVASRSVSIAWGEISVLEADLICMEDLLRYKMWKYFINLTGQEFPLKTNWQIVKILKSFKGANDIQAVAKRRKFEIQRTCFKAPAPHNITIYKGTVHMLVSRAFVEFIFYNPKAEDFLAWTNGTEIPDETFFTSLQHNPQLGVPGSHYGVPEPHSQFSNALSSELLPHQKFDVEDSVARYKLWDPEKCGGKRVRQICILSQYNLPALTTTPKLFANKFHYDYRSRKYGLDCLQEWFWNQTRDEYLKGSRFNTRFYSNLSFVRFRENTLY